MQVFDYIFLLCTVANLIYIISAMQVFDYIFLTCTVANLIYILTAMQVFDYIFLTCTVAWPTLQSGFLTYKRHLTHSVYLSLEDNRQSAVDN